MLLSWVLPCRSPLNCPTVPVLLSAAAAAVARMFPSSFRSYGPGRRKDSAIRTLVAETLVLAKTHGCVEKIESELEEELRRESKGQASDPLSKWRRKGDKALKSKYVLLTVALFCVTDCALVLGELILDLHRVKDTLETSERTIHEFKMTLQKTYPSYIVDIDADIKDIFDLISRSRIIWHDDSHLRQGDNSTNSSLPFPSTLSPEVRYSGADRDTGSIVPPSSTTPRSVITVRRRRSTGSHIQEETEYIVVPSEELQQTHRNQSGAQHDGKGHGKGHEKHSGESHSLEEEIAHALHLTSVTLMSILMFESLLKAFCAGLCFFKRKLETFDLFIVVVSFIVDIVFMQILPRFKIQDFVFILAFLLPWRVIRVVNSLVVAVQDHEHFRLKMVYSRKKKIQNSLRETEVKLQLFRAQCCALKRLCLNEGVEESKIEEIVQLDEYVVNRTGKSKCKVKIDNASVILLDKSDFLKTSPRPSIANLLDKKRNPPSDSAKEPAKCDRFLKRNGHTLTVDDALQRDSRWKGKARKMSLSFSNGPLGSLFGPRELESVPETSSTTIRRAGSQSQICEAIKRDLLSAGVSGDGERVKRVGSHCELSQATASKETGDSSRPGLKSGSQAGGSLRDVSDLERKGSSFLREERADALRSSETADSEVPATAGDGDEVSDVGVVPTRPVNLPDKVARFSDTVEAVISHHHHCVADTHHVLLPNGNVPSIPYSTSEHSETSSDDDGDAGRVTTTNPQARESSPAAVSIEAAEVILSPEVATPAITQGRLPQAQGPELQCASEEPKTTVDTAERPDSDVNTKPCPSPDQHDCVVHIEALSDSVVGADSNTQSQDVVIMHSPGDVVLNVKASPSGSTLPYTPKDFVVDVPQSDADSQHAKSGVHDCDLIPSTPAAGFNGESKQSSPKDGIEQQDCRLPVHFDNEELGSDVEVSSTTFGVKEDVASEMADSVTSGVTHSRDDVDA